MLLLVLLISYPENGLKCFEEFKELKCTAASHLWLWNNMKDNEQR